MEDEQAEIIAAEYKGPKKDALKKQIANAAANAPCTEIDSLVEVPMSRAERHRESSYVSAFFSNHTSTFALGKITATMAAFGSTGIGLYAMIKEGNFCANATAAGIAMVGAVLYLTGSLLSLINNIIIYRSNLFYRHIAAENANYDQSKIYSKAEFIAQIIPLLGVASAAIEMAFLITFYVGKANFGICLAAVFIGIFSPFVTHIFNLYARDKLNLVNEKLRELYSTLKEVNTGWLNPDDFANVHELENNTLNNMIAKGFC